MLSFAYNYYYMRQNSKKTKKIVKIYLISLILLALCAQGAYVAAEPSRRTIEAIRQVSTNPDNDSVSAFINAMIREYRKSNWRKEYEDAADYLRAALYFLSQKPDTRKYESTLNKLNKVLSKLEVDMSSENRLEIAKNLFLEGKYFASGYEFSILLKEEYEPDLCYEYMGDIARKFGSDETAFAFYQKSLEINPDNLNAKYKYANLLLKQGKNDYARIYFEEVIENTNSEGVINEIINTFINEINANPDDENNYGILGLAYQKLGQYDKTYQLLKKAIMMNPNDIFLMYYLGNLLFNIGEYSFADEIYTEILEENPYESQIRISRAKSYAAISEYEKAIKDYQIVLAMYPDSLQAQYGMYTLLKDRIPLERIVNLFYPLEPDYKLTDEGYNSLGYLANKMGNTMDASVFFEKSLKLNPKSEIPYIELYKIYQLLGLDDKAKETLLKGYKLFPKNREILDLYSAANSDKIDEKNNVAMSYMNEGEYKKAIAVYSQIEPKTAETYEAVANCYRQLADFKNAIINYNKSVEINPENSEVYYALGVTYLEANNTDKAKEMFTKSLEKDERNIKSKKMLAFIEQKEIIKSLDLAYEFYEKKDYASALRYLDSAVQTFPNDAKVYYYRGLTRSELGDYKGAVEDLKETVAIDRTYIVAYYKLGEFLEKLNKEKEAMFMYEKYLGAETLDPELAKKAQQKVIQLGEKYY